MNFRLPTRLYLEEFWGRSDCKRKEHCDLLAESIMATGDGTNNTYYIPYPKNSKYLNEQKRDEDISFMEWRK